MEIEALCHNTLHSAFPPKGLRSGGYSARHALMRIQYCALFKAKSIKLEVLALASTRVMAISTSETRNTLFEPLCGIPAKPCEVRRIVSVIN